MYILKIDLLTIFLLFCFKIIFNVMNMNIFLKQENVQNKKIFWLKFKSKRLKKIKKNNSDKENEFQDDKTT